VSRARKYLPSIKADVDLLERLIETYEASKKARRMIPRACSQSDPSLIQSGPFLADEG
jgi:hypothetical protein